MICIGTSSIKYSTVSPENIGSARPPTRNKAFSYTKNTQPKSAIAENNWNTDSIDCGKHHIILIGTLGIRVNERALMKARAVFSYNEDASESYGTISEFINHKLNYLAN